MQSFRNLPFDGHCMSLRCTSDLDRNKGRSEERKTKDQEVCLWCRMDRNTFKAFSSLTVRTSSSRNLSALLNAVFFVCL